MINIFNKVFSYFLVLTFIKKKYYLNLKIYTLLINKKLINLLLKIYY